MNYPTDVGPIVARDVATAPQGSPQSVEDVDSVYLERLSTRCWMFPGS